MAYYSEIPDLQAMLPAVIRRLPAPPRGALVRRVLRRLTVGSPVAWCLFGLVLAATVAAATVGGRAPLLAVMGLTITAAAVLYVRFHRTLLRFVETPDPADAQRIRLRLCALCDYATQGNPNDHCPECGERVVFPPVVAP